MLAIFISESAFKTIVLSESTKPASGQSYLYRIMRELKKLYVSAESSDTSWAKQYKEKYGLIPDFSLSDYIKGISAHPETVLQHPSSVYVLNITITEAERIQRSYGVICLSEERLDISPLIDVNDIYVSTEHEKLGRGWDSVLDSVEGLPSNALLLTDRYLFAFRHPNAGDGLANIRAILDELLPQQFLGDDYHVTVVFDNINKHKSYTFDEIATKLNRIKTQLRRDYPIMMEVLGVTPDCSIYNKLHNRLIVSNYYMVEAGHKLAAFNQDKGTTRQTLLPLALFTESSLNGKSTPPLKAINQTLSTLRDFTNSLSKLTDHNVYLYAVNGQRMEKCMGIRNRLIK